MLLESEGEKAFCGNTQSPRDGGAGTAEDGCLNLDLWHCR